MRATCVQIVGEAQRQDCLHSGASLGPTHPQHSTAQRPGSPTHRAAGAHTARHSAAQHSTAQHSRRPTHLRVEGLEQAGLCARQLSSRHEASFQENGVERGACCRNPLALLLLARRSPRAAAAAARGSGRAQPTQHQLPAVRAALGKVGWHVRGGVIARAATRRHHGGGYGRGQ